MDPTQQPYQNQPPAPVVPTTNMQFGTMPPGTLATSALVQPPTKNKLFLPLCVVAVLELLLIIGLLIALSSNHKVAVTPAKAADSSLSQDPQPATTTGIQQTNDVISQDITNLDVDASFPANALDDTSLLL